MFTIWTDQVKHTIAEDGVYRYGLHQDQVLWQQPKYGGPISILHSDPDGKSVLTYKLERRGA